MAEAIIVSLLSVNWIVPVMLRIIMATTPKKQTAVKYRDKLYRFDFRVILRYIGKMTYIASKECQRYKKASDN